jgi:hypothetical protein
MDKSVANTWPPRAAILPRGGCKSIDRVVTARARLFNDAPDTTWIDHSRTNNTANNTATAPATIVRRIVTCEPVLDDADIVGVAGVATSGGAPLGAP